MDKKGGAKRSPLFISSAISEHLRSLGYPETSILSMEKCGKETSFEFIKHCEDCGFSEKGNFKHRCNSRFCPICLLTRKRRVKNSYMPLIKEFPTTRGSPNSLYFLTISPSNYQDLKLGLNQTLVQWKKFLRHPYIKDRVKGGLWVIELKNKNKYGESKGWNVHIHSIFYGRRLDNVIRGQCLNCHQNYIKHDELGDFYYCTSRKCNSRNVTYKQESKLVSCWKRASKSDVHINIKEITYGGARGVLSYVLKYISSDKAEFLDDFSFAIAILFTRKKKLINTFGIFYDYDPPKVSLDCSKCGGKLFFITDREVVSAYGETYDHDPPDYPSVIWQLKSAEN